MPWRGSRQTGACARSHASSSCGSRPQNAPSTRSILSSTVTASFVGQRLSELQIQHVRSAPVNATVESTITFPYRRSLGPVIGAFMTGLAEQRLIGIRNGKRVICPPVEWDPDTGDELPVDLVDVGPAGTVETWCWVPVPTEQHPLDRPFAFATIRLDGADTALVHVVDAGSADQMAIGMRVAPRWRPERTGHITDIESFVLGEQP